MESHIQQFESAKWNSQIKRLITSQLIGVVCISGLVAYFFSSMIAMSFFTGGLLVLMNASLMAMALCKHDVGVKHVYRSAVVRYIVFLLGLLVLAVLGMGLLAVAAGMFAAYVLAYFCSAWLVGSIKGE